MHNFRKYIVASKLGVLEPLWVKFFEKNFLGGKNFLDPLPRENRQKSVKNGQNGKLTWESQVKITLFCYKMVNSVMELQIWSPKILFWYDLRPISVQKLVKMVNFGEL